MANCLHICAERGQRHAVCMLSNLNSVIISRSSAQARSSGPMQNTRTSIGPNSSADPGLLHSPLSDPRLQQHASNLVQNYVVCSRDPTKEDLWEKILQLGPHTGLCMQILVLAATGELPRTQKNEVCLQLNFLMVFLKFYQLHCKAKLPILGHFSTLKKKLVNICSYLHTCRPTTVLTIVTVPALNLLCLFQSRRTFSYVGLS